MKATLDKGQFGPWVLVTGASSGIGKPAHRTSHCLGHRSIGRLVLLLRKGKR